MIIMARNKKWRDLTTTEKAHLVLRGIVQFALLAAALVDIHRRPAEEINGSKWLWSAVALVNFMGVISLGIGTLVMAALALVPRRRVQVATKLIGAEPRTKWLPLRLERDEKGFVLTGQDLVRNGRLPCAWSLERHPMALETSVSGVFAAGDVRHQSVKRVASAVGEGSIAIRLIHEYLG